MTEPYQGTGKERGEETEQNTSADVEDQQRENTIPPPPEPGNVWANDPLISKDVGFDIDEEDLEFGGIELEDWEKDAIRSIVQEDVRQRDVAINSKIRAAFGPRYPNRERKPPAKQ